MTMNRFLDAPREDARAVLLTGATGLLGSLLAATLLKRTSAIIVAPVRERHTEDGVWEIIRSELERMTSDDVDSFRERVIVTRLPETSAIPDLLPICREHGVDEIVHAAGSVDYFKKDVLEEANIRLTEGLLDVAKELDGSRFVFISTAFSCGFRGDDVDIPEALHDEPEEDPTEYTASKRRAEHVVARSGVPYLILRPSVVVGDSKDGHYNGKPYGVYQFYAAGERLLSDKAHEELHMVAPPAPLQVVHQDAFCEGFFEARRWLADGAVVHLVSHRDNLPTMRDALDRGVKYMTPFDRIYVYDRIEDVDLKSLTRRMRMMTEFAAVNTEIACRTWRFSTDTIDELKRRGADLADANADSIELCLKWFVEQSTRLQDHMKRFPEKQDVKTEYILVGPAKRVANG